MSCLAQPTFTDTSKLFCSRPDSCALRNQAMIYCLLETGMRRAVVLNLDLADVDFKKKALAVREKGGLVHRYQISAEGLQAIRDYIDSERKTDAKVWDSPALFLPSATVP